MASQSGVERTMRSLTRAVAVCGAIGVLSSVSISLLLTWIYGAYFALGGPVLFSVACERVNTLALGIWTFAIVFALGIMGVVLRELRQRAFEQLRQRTTEEGESKRESKRGRR